MKRSYLSVLAVLATLLVVVFVVGCGDGETEGTESTTTSGAANGEGGTTSTSATGEVGSVSVMGLWGGTELESFQAVVAGWEEQTGGTMQFEGTRDLTAILRARISGGNPPDVAILPNPALLQQFAADGSLLPLDDVLDMDVLRNDYSEAWIEQGSAGGQLYGVFVKAATKATVWYSPAQFQSNNLEVPTTWDEMIALSNQIVEGGMTPWSVGVEAGAASAWPASDWVQEILLHESGPDVYDKWVKHEIPWTDPAVKSAFERFGRIVHTQGYIPGGSQFVLATGPEDASYLPFEDPPRAFMYFLGDFAQGFITAQFPDLRPGEDFDFFPFPAINSEFANSTTGGADVVVMLRDTPSARSLVQYLARGDSWVPWAERGGYTSPNKSFDTSVYPNEIIAKAAELLTGSEIFRFDADDSMPAEVQQAFWQALLDYIQNPGNLDNALQSVEDVAQGAYQQ